MLFSILFTDDHFIAINKPPGILMHRTRISEDTVFVVQLLRDQLGQRVYPVHRLDRATSGALIFGKTPEAAGLLGEQVMDKTVEKKYLVVVRGWTPESGTIDYALDDPDSGKGRLPAITHFIRLGTSEIDAPIGLRYKTARFSLVEARLETGRRHQIRKHFAHLNHPVIGDKRHGDVKQNTYFREVFGMKRMLLHASELEFRHPFTGKTIRILAPVDEEFMQGLEMTELSVFLPKALIAAKPCK
ncbi:MAG: pseudouridylate synthase [Haliscomenobacteraceae bacterium CHB4]|nr:pseudouridylate synthase [Haliscomenobacteraceae bacterium CHB4]